MAARIVHHAAAERLLKCVEFKNPDRFRFGIIMPDSAGWACGVEQPLIGHTNHHAL